MAPLQFAVVVGIFTVTAAFGAPYIIDACLVVTPVYCCVAAGCRLASTSDHDLLVAPAFRLMRHSSCAVVPRHARGFGEPLPLRAPKPPEGCRSVEIADVDGSLWQVLVGKNAHDNDRLTFDIGQPDEAWMHVASVPGSHVVVRRIPSGTADPPQDVLETAAGICAFHSKARGRSSVEVHLTTCGKVVKLPGAPAGQVMLRGSWETLTVCPLDPAGLQGRRAAVARHRPRG